jgi:hypothetical protein
MQRHLAWTRHQVQAQADLVQQLRLQRQRAPGTDVPRRVRASAAQLRSMHPIRSRLHVHEIIQLAGCTHHHLLELALERRAVAQ